ncbi:MAG: PQQ-binding-like beta-propeller repeat protein [Candidatus Bathyarchaeota archaeon]|nr:PQQ-binding-like beta-propeller repeat protein [Candidatus Bathyarchaeum sp.]
MIKINKKILSSTFAVLIIALLGVSIFAFQTPLISTAQAQSTQITTIPSNLLQYDWPTPSASPTGSYFSNGPAPSSPSIQWKALDELGVVVGPLVAFDGMVFAQVENATIALDAATGDIVWRADGVGGSAPAYGFGSGICKIDDDYMVIGSTCVRIADGTTVWVGPPGFSAPYLMWWGGGYIPELKMLVDANFGWDMSDPSQPPTLAWSHAGQYDGGTAYPVYGDGKLFVGCADLHLRAYDAKTGTLIWETPATVTTFVYGMAYGDGKVFHGGLDGNMRAWDADTGELLWTYNPGTWYGQWASSAAYAYGMVYEKNQDTYLYAINGTTGELVWRAKGPGIGYPGTVAIADGKIYSGMGENIYRDFQTGEYAYSEYNCYDAYTGELIWTLPLENGGNMNYQCIAYGNLYIVPTVSSTEVGVYTYTLRGTEVWCIGSEVKDWSMLFGDPEHTTEGSGPTNLALKWKFNCSAGIVSSPTLADGVCYFGCVDKKIYAIDAATGTELWTFKTAYQVKSSPAVVNGRLYTGADDGNVYCLDAATGNKIWQADVPEDILIDSTLVRSSPIVAGCNVYVGGLDGNLYCFDASNGDVLWQFQTGGPISATPTIVDNAIYISATTPSPNGTLYKLDANTGNEIWNVAIPYFYSVGNNMLASPTVAEGMVFVRGSHRFNYALNATTGETIWMYDGLHNPGTPEQLGGAQQRDAILYKYGRVYFCDYYGISCRNATDGTELWYTYLSRETFSPGLSYAYQRIYVVTEAQVLYVLDALTGEKISYYGEFNGHIWSTPTPYNGNLYVGCIDWGLYCFEESRTASFTSEAPSASLSSEQIMLNTMETTEKADISTETAITAAIAVACTIGIVSFYILRKRK